MVDIQVAPATPERAVDVLEVFTGSGDRDCWCQYWRQSSSAYSSNAPGSGKKDLLQQVRNGPPPGMLAYFNDRPVGWLGFWPRENLERLAHSRTIPKIDDKPVWSIVCFKIQVGYRRKGIAKALLRGAIETAREFGAPAIEAYPIDPQGERIDVSLGYVGFIKMFEAAGFQRIVETSARSDGRTRILMRLTF
ncbi:MAG TPA: GNAT family N-acetyltransferase [Terriglobia bacterium]|nr:GNAT family N-acetyltransferase [Terriglobia bacterium]